MRSLITVFFLLFVGLCHAETIPATAGPNVANTSGMTWLGIPVFNYGGSSEETSRQACIQGKNANYLGATVAVSGDFSSRTCKRADGSTDGHQVTAYCSNGMQNIGGWPSCGYGGGVASYSCPTGQNWTLSGSSCIRPDCAVAESRVPATGLCSCISTATYQGGWRLYTGASLQIGTEGPILCKDGCYVQEYSMEIKTVITGGVKQNYSRQEYQRLTGASCSATTVPQESASLPLNSCGAGQTGGTVTIGGVTRFMCVSSSSGQAIADTATPAPVEKTESTTTTQANPDSTTTTTTTTTNKITQEQTVTTTIKDAQGQLLSTKNAGSQTGDPTKAGPDAVSDDVAAQAKADSLPGSLGGTGGRWQTSALGLPSMTTYAALDSSAAQGVLPSNAGGVVTLDVTLPYMGTMTINPAPVVNAVRPLVDFMVVMLSAIAALFAVLKKSED